MKETLKAIGYSLLVNAILGFPNFLIATEYHAGIIFAGFVLGSLLFFTLHHRDAAAFPRHWNPARIAWLVHFGLVLIIVALLQIPFAGLDATQDDVRIQSIYFRIQGDILWSRYILSIAMTIVVNAVLFVLAGLLPGGRTTASASTSP